MRFGHFDETEQSEDVDVDIESMDDVDNMEDAEDIDEVEDAEDIDDMDEMEDIEDMDEVEDIEDDADSPEDGDAGDEDEDSGQESNRPSWELSPEEKADVNDRTAEVVKDYRERNNLDEHGQKLDNGEGSTDSAEDADSPDTDQTQEAGMERVPESRQGAEIDDDELEL